VLHGFYTAIVVTFIENMSRKKYLLINNNELVYDTRVLIILISREQHLPLSHKQPATLSKKQFGLLELFYQFFIQIKHISIRKDLQVH